MIQIAFSILDEDFTRVVVFETAVRVPSSKMTMTRTRTITIIMVDRCYCTDPSRGLP